MTHHRPHRRLGLAVVSLLAATLGQHAHAQSAGSGEPATQPTEIKRDDAQQWRFMLGAGVVSRPEYPGSDSNQTRFAPLLSASHGRYFFGGLPVPGLAVGAGAYFIQTPETRLGLVIGTGISKAREESDDERLRGMGDIDAATRAALFASHKTHDWLTWSSSISADVSGKDQGIIATLDAEAKYRVTDRLAFSAGPGLTWASDDYTQTFFGVSADQSARSGLQAYTAKSGLNLLRFSVGAEYGLSRQWGISARASFARLQGDAADSPITRKRSQNTYGLFTSYRF